MYVIYLLIPSVHEKYEHEKLWSSIICYVQQFIEQSINLNVYFLLWTVQCSFTLYVCVWSLLIAATTSTTNYRLDIDFCDEHWTIASSTCALIVLGLCYTSERYYSTISAPNEVWVMNEINKHPLWSNSETITSPWSIFPALNLSINVQELNIHRTFSTICSILF